MAKDILLERATTESIIGAFYDVYNKLGYGFVEHIYSLALERELLKRGHTVQRELVVTIFYDGEPLANQRVDMVVDRKVVIENKSTFALPPDTRRRTLNYLKASDLGVGLILHFGPSAKFYRVVRSNQPTNRIAEER